VEDEHLANNKRKCRKHKGVSTTGVEIIDDALSLLYILLTLIKCNFSSIGTPEKIKK
jgi:hypothetical protein